MNKKTIETKLNQEIEQSIPDILDSIVNTPIEKMEEHDYITHQTVIKRPKYQKMILAICINFMIIIAVYTSWYQFISVDNIIDIDVNPSIEITSNRQGKVLKVESLNDDANIILGNMNLEKMDLDIAINAIMGSMLKNGYINANSNTILISVQNKDADRAAKLQEHIANSITSSFKKSGIMPEIIQQTISPDDDLKKLSKEYNVSLGKIFFIKQLTKVDNSLDFNQLSKASLEELMHLAKNNQIDIHKFANYRDNDSDNDDNEVEEESGGEKSQKNDNYDKDDNSDEEKDDDSKMTPITPGINPSKPHQNTVRGNIGEKTDTNQNNSSTPTSLNNNENDFEEDADTDTDTDADTDTDTDTDTDDENDFKDNKADDNQNNSAIPTSLNNNEPEPEPEPESEEAADTDDDKDNYADYNYETTNDSEDN